MPLIVRLTEEPAYVAGGLKEAIAGADWVTTKFNEVSLPNPPGFTTWIVAIV